MIKKSVLLVLFFIIPLLLPGQEDLPGQVAGAGDASDFPQSPLILVFDKTRVEVMDSGLSHVHMEVLYKVLNPEGAKKLKTVVFGYDPQSAFVKIRAARIIRKNGRVIELDVSQVRDYPAPARAIYWGAREKLLPVGRLEPGDGLWIQSYRKGFTYALLYQEDDSKYIPPMKGHFYDIVPFYSSYPVNLKSYRVSLPGDKVFQYEFYNGTARHFAHVDGDRRIYFWEKKNIRPLEKEPNMVSLSDVAPKLLVSTSPDWKAKSLWFYRVNEDYGSFEFDQEILNKTREIIHGARTDMEKISRLTHWVAEEIRYSGISMGEGEGYTLHKGTMTFRDRCGVCKDKAGMLVTMLRAAGFESYPAMTMAGSRIDRIPADQFNHSVTLVKLNGKYKLLDPTWVPGVRELWSSAEQQQQYLMGIPEGADLKTTPISPPENHYLKYHIRTTLDRNNRMKARVTIRAEGQSDSTLRRLFRRRLQDQWEDMLLGKLVEFHPAIRVSNLSYHDPYDLSQPMKIRFDLELDNVLYRGSGEAFFTPLSSRLFFSSALFHHRIKTTLKKRKYPFRTRCSQWVEVSETIRIPRGFTLVFPEKFQVIEGTGADFSGRIFQKGRDIHIHKKLLTKKRIYPPEDWESYRNAVLEFEKPAGGWLILKSGDMK